MQLNQDAEWLDVFAAAFTVLGRLHLSHAETSTREDVWANLDEWPFWDEPVKVRELTNLHDEAMAAQERGVELLRTAQQRQEDDTEIRMDWDFLYGISASAKVSPFESVHLGEEHLVFDAETLNVRAHYAKLGLQAPRLHTEPDDHIGLEFDFLAKAALMMLAALAENREDDFVRIRDVAADFTRLHPLRWVPPMLRRAEKQAQTSWLQGVEALSFAAFATWCEALVNRDLLATGPVLEGFDPDIVLARNL